MPETMRLTSVALEQWGFPQSMIAPLERVDDRTSPAGGLLRASYEVVGVYRETASGVRLDRAERRKVMALAQRREIDAVLVTELSRWGFRPATRKASP